ncbi:Cof-type HAD-IIB family hydrolase [Peribacillus sp. SCS-155]|uniref:Cof-type HAD-IIB family hydrolase n=1 Tax=Peribacillus sedimenti TaxID=3115297 RepID=UPI003905C0FC
MIKNKIIKLIACDMDGTLLNESGNISEGNRSAIKAAEATGVKVILSTGRAYMTCSEYAESLELSSYLITVNGSEIYDDKGLLIERNPVRTELIQWMHDLSTKHKTRFWAVSADNVWRGKMPVDITQHEWLKFGFDFDEDTIKEEVYQLLMENGTLEISNSSPTNLEINALGINKAKAIEKVCSRMGITMENVMALGDSLNDIAMIKEAGIGVAMGNAQEIVREAADYVTNTNEDDGVARAIEKFVLNN